jgi:hypothetical protein
MVIEEFWKKKLGNETIALGIFLGDSKNLCTFSSLFSLGRRNKRDSYFLLQSIKFQNQCLETPVSVLYDIHLEKHAEISTYLLDRSILGFDNNVLM